MNARTILAMSALAVGLTAGVFLAVRGRPQPVPRVVPHVSSRPGVDPAPPRVSLSVEQEHRSPAAIATSSVAADDAAAEPAVEAREPELEPALRILVVDDGDLPVEGARVELYRGPRVAPLEAATSDGWGLASVSGARAGDELRATAPGLVERTLTLDRGPWPDPLELRLGVGIAAIAGRTIDDAGEPVPRARLVFEGEGRRLSAVGDDDGAFVLRAASAAAFPSEAHVAVSAAGHVFLGTGFTLPLPEPGAEGVEVVLHRCARLAVRVADSGGTPVPSATVQLVGGPDQDLRELVPGLGTGVFGVPASEAGAFGLDRVPPVVPLGLEVVAPGLGRRTVELGSFAPGEEREVTVELAGMWSGEPWRYRVVDEAGLPVARGRVVAQADLGTVRSATYVELGAGGAFELEAPATTRTLEVRAPGFEPARFEEQATRRPAQPHVLRLRTTGSAVRVRVVDEEGVARGGVVVRIEDERPTAGRFTAALPTGDDGRAACVGVDDEATYSVVLGMGRPGAYLLGDADATRVSSPCAYRDVRAGDVELVFRLVPPASLGGRVTGTAASDGRLAGSRVHLSCFESREAPAPPVFTVAGVFQADGGFRFDGLPPGHYRLWSPTTDVGPSFERPLATFDLFAGDRLDGVTIDR